MKQETRDAISTVLAVLAKGVIRSDEAQRILTGFGAALEIQEIVEKPLQNIPDDSRWGILQYYNSRGRLWRLSVTLDGIVLSTETAHDPHVIFIRSERDIGMGD